MAALGGAGAVGLAILDVLFIAGVLRRGAC